MAGFGFGARRRRAAPRKKGVPLISPSAGWSGVATSGFASTPVDPPRTTAKPVLRLIVPPNQYYTGELLVGVYAGANYAGSLQQTMGLSKVIAHYAGSSIDITAPSFQTFNDANGNPVTYFGWWVKLKHDGRHGHARLYFEAVPRDTSMQRRVIGPYQYSPQPALHDYSVTVEPSQPQIVGSRYQTLIAAMTYLRGVSAGNPLIDIKEPGNYDIAGGTGGTTYVGQGWLTVKASVPATIAKSGYTTDTNASIRTRYDRTRFAGANILFDTAYIAELRIETDSYWLDGVKVTNSLGKDQLWHRKGSRPVSWFVRGRAWITECDIERINDPLRQAALARGCTVRDCFNDVASGCWAVIGNSFSNMNSEAFWLEKAALTVSYGGPGATATVELAGGNAASSRTLTAKVGGATVGTFTIQSSEAAYTANTNYTVQNVVTWLNSLSGWSATLLDNSRFAAVLSKSGNSGAAFSATDVKSAPLTLVTTFDYHADFYADESGGENVVIFGNKGTNHYNQDIFFYSPSGARDYHVVNNAFHNGTSTNPNHAAQSSQLGYVHSHVVIAHNTLANQALLLRVDTGYAPDGYSMIANNVCRDFSWQGPGNGVLVLARNHLHTGAVGAAIGDQTTVGGTLADLFAGAASGDFTPSGALVANLKTPVVSFDRGGRQRGQPDAAGSLAI